MNILDLREYRDAVEYSLSKDYNLVTIRPNFPGSDKRNIYSNFVSIIGLAEILKYVDVKEFYSSYSEEGLIFYIQCSEDVVKLKEAAIIFERWFQIGRLLDIDIRNDKGQISRTDLDFAKRKCFLCNERAHFCIRTKNHTFSEIEEFFRKEVIKYLYEGDRRYVFSKFFIFASSIEFYKRMVYIEEDYWKVNKNLLEIEFLNKILEIADIFRNNTLNLDNEKNYRKIFNELKSIFDRVSFIEEEHIHILMHLYNNYANNTNISFIDLFNNEVDVTNIIIIADSIKERTDINNGLLSLINILIRDKKKLQLSDDDCLSLVDFKNKRETESLRNFVYKRDGMFYYTYSLSIFSLILLLMENTKKEVYDFGY